MNERIHIDNNDYWLSYQYLSDKGIPHDSARNWSKRNVCECTYIDGRAYIHYDTIPDQTRSKLPTKEEILKEYNSLKYNENYFLIRDRYEEMFTDLLKHEYSSINTAKWRNIILEKYDVSIEKAVEFSRKASVIECAVRIRDEYEGYKGVLETLYRAYKKIYPNSYSQKPRFCMVLTRAKEEGILSVAVNLNRIRKPKEKYGDLHKYLASFVLSHNKAYHVTECYEMFTGACKRLNEETPCWEWFKAYHKKNKNLHDKGALGKTAYDNDNRLYANIIPAMYAGDQWQIDGWRIPIYCKKPNSKGGFEYYVTYTLFAVLDAHSRRIIGSYVAESENTETILKGLENAVKHTDLLPYEIVSDNHSFNKTKEAGSFKEDLEKEGVHWTVDSNPRRKAILERAFRTLGDKHFKRTYGYIGQGVKSKVKKGITQDELKAIYTKPDNMLTFDQVAAITESIIYDYNNAIIKKFGETPNERYEKSEKRNSKPVDLFKRLALFVRKSESKITHGQIAITRAGEIYTYQIPAQYQDEYNGKTVGIRYIDFDEIYVYEKDSDNPICRVPLKQNIHGAMANQTEADTENLYKNSGRIKGVEVKGRKKKEGLFDGANTVNPEAYGVINYLTASKDHLEQIRQNYNIKHELSDKYEVNSDMIRKLPIIDEMLDAAMKPRRRDEKSPYYVENESDTLEKIIINKGGTL